MIHSNKRLKKYKLNDKKYFYIQKLPTFVLLIQIAKNPRYKLHLYCTLNHSHYIK